MKKIILIFMCYIFSLSINARCFYNEDDLYKSVSELIEFCESGLKISYEVSDDITEILQSINNLNLSYFKDDFEIKNDYTNNFNFENNNDEASVKVLISGKEQKYNVEIEIIEKDKLINVKETKKKLNKLLKKDYKYNYFTFIKGKVKEEFKDELEKNLYNILDIYNIQNKSSVLLENGLTGIFTTEENLKINYSIMNYNNGTYLIMGSPIIFVTY